MHLSRSAMARSESRNSGKRLVRRKESCAYEVHHEIAILHMLSPGLPEGSHLAQHQVRLEPTPYCRQKM